MKVSPAHKSALLFFLLMTVGISALSQKVLTLQGDSIKLTNCDSTELILENHSQGVKGFLYNTGRGRTIFKQGVVKVNDSLFLIGADSLKYNAWVQGGNSFRTTGILGTNDNNSLDFYTNNTFRERVTNAGNVLIGTTMDNGSLLQVNGISSFSGNMKVGAATIQNNGYLLGTNAVLFNHVVAASHNYPNSDIYISKLDNVLYNYQNRLKTTMVTGADSTINIDIVIPPDEIATGNLGLVYGEGYMCFSFWNNGLPQSVSVMMRDSATQSWFGPFTTSTNSGTGGGGYYIIQIGSMRFINEIKITIAHVTGVPINLQNIEYVTTNDINGLANPHPYLGKAGPEALYNSTYWKNAGDTNAMMSPYTTQPSYFMSSVLLGARKDNGTGNRLQVTGNASVTGSIGIGTISPAAQLHTTGTVRFAGLTNDSTKTRILVSDASGNIFYRNASSLVSTAINQPPGGTLAVDGSIKARDLRLNASNWADYVFAPGYRLRTLAETMTYIRINGHLPDIPSAAEVEREGLNIGDNQASLLRKIEELTLYAAEQEGLLKEQRQAQEIQDKVIQMQQVQIDNLKEELTVLKKLVEHGKR